MTIPTMSPRDAAIALVLAFWGAATISTGCASHRLPVSPYTWQPGDENVAVLIIWPGEDRQAQILSFDGVPFAAFVGSRVQPGHFRIPVPPGTHEVRLVVPGQCTYYDGSPGPGNFLSNMRFVAKAGAQYEFRLDSRPSQLFTWTTVHIYEVVKAPYEFRSVEQPISSRPDPSSCPYGRGMVR
jgi:hypothetical protein